MSSSRRRPNWVATLIQFSYGKSFAIGLGRADLLII